jgi:hypothetical protein
MSQTLRVDVVDVKGKGMSGVVLAINSNNYKNPNPTILLEFEASGDRFESFVTQVTHSVSLMPCSISALRLWAHAIVFDLKDDIPKGEAMLAAKPLTLQDVRLRRSTLGKLKPFFSDHPKTRFEFRGCGVANNDGLAMMKELADLWGIRVHAGELNQGAGMAWDGPVVEALPDGRLVRADGLPFDSKF